MPTDRLLHRRAGRSEKVSSLTDLEYRVWTQYLLSADDFGIMPASPAVLQSDNFYFMRCAAKKLQRALSVLVSVQLLRSFVHQHQTYVYQHDWQDWQKIRWPAKTINPEPPREFFSEETQLLFRVFPGGQKVPTKSDGSTSEVPTKTYRSSSEVLTPTRETANPNSLRPTASGGGRGEPTARPATLIQKRRMDAAWEGGRVWVPQRAHSDFLGYRGGNEPELLAWYEAVDSEYSGEIDPDMFAFWRARYREKWPTSTAKKSRWDNWTPTPKEAI